MASVTIYTRQLCGFCSRAKSLLEKKGVDYVEHDATFSPDLRKEMIQKANGRATFPQISINGGTGPRWRSDRPCITATW